MSEFLGVAFSPYVGPANQLWNSYSQQDIVRMLEIIEPYFNKISTYSMGYDGYPPTTPWNQVNSNCHIVGAAAQLNQLRGKIAFEVSQGIYQQTNQQQQIDMALQQAEIDAAFAAASLANTSYPNTVTSFVFTNEYVTDAEKANAVNQMIVANKEKAHNLGIKVGVRSNTFGEIANPNSAYYNELKGLIQNCDFIQCNLYPASESVTPQDGVNAVGQAFYQIKTAVSDVNPPCEMMIGETGWPSEGISFNNTNNNVANLLAYYEAIDKWAFENRVTTYFFEAFDEPWKSNHNSQYSAEGHYGIWYLNDQGEYKQKKV
ncbi:MULTISPECIES: glycosyl hydrolase family 17 protein [unclassified Microcoleus]|uniref:glycosyl hydrolase family 17 protein n=1 Tax=unclassified Microcoleus TaxID=2642155 RepID=UPI002FD131C3